MLKILRWRKNLTLFVMFIFIISTSCFAQPIGGQKVYAATNFITRSVDKLMDGSSEFRFISYNPANIQLVQNASPGNNGDGWRWPDPYEQEDCINTIAQTGGNAFRMWGLPIYGSAESPPQQFCYVTGIRTYNETAFRCLDKMLQLANQYNVRVIMGFLNNYAVFGGSKAFAALEGKTESDFYTDPTVIADYKDLISYVLNRTNYYTGIQYKNDKAIMAWETMGENVAPDSWTNDIAQYIKSIDTNHLVMDGHYGITTNGLNNPNIDIVSDHYYDSKISNTPGALCNTDRNKCIGYKPFIIGETGGPGSNYSKFQELFNAAINNGTSGIMLWSLRFRAQEGGFYWHQWPGYGYMWAYHWPGFASGAAYDEINVMNLVKQSAYQIRGLAVPPLDVPSAPFLLPISNTNSISWRGSTGAQTYDIERATSAGGPWTVVGRDVLDSDNPYRPFNDATAVSGQSYYYRVKAKNTSGISNPSNVVGPVTAAGSILTDEMNDFSKMYSHTANLTFDTTNTQYFNGDTSRLYRTTSTYENIVYNTPGDMTSIMVDTYFWPYESVVDFKFYTSSDGLSYTEFTPTKSDLGGTWDRIKYQSTSLPAATRYLKIEFRNTSVNNWNPQISRLEIGYSASANLVQNPGFETGSFAPWSPTSSDWVVTSADKHSGTYSAMMTGTGIWQCITQNISVTPNTNYTWTLYGKSSTNQGFLKVLTSGGAVITQLQVTGDNLWDRYTINFNSGSNSTVMLYIGCSTGTQYFDDNCVN